MFKRFPCNLLLFLWKWTARVTSPPCLQEIKKTAHVSLESHLGELREPTHSQMTLLLYIDCSECSGRGDSCCVLNCHNSDNSGEKNHLQCTAKTREALQHSVHSNGIFKLFMQAATVTFQPKCKEFPLGILKKKTKTKQPSILSGISVSASLRLTFKTVVKHLDMLLCTCALWWDLTTKSWHTWRLNNLTINTWHNYETVTFYHCSVAPITFWCCAVFFGRGLGLWLGLASKNTHQEVT